mgnify:CR=1 FL=1
MKKEFVKQPFEPVFDSNSRILILGSFPSIVSRKQQFYYMNPQNRFWKILDALFETSFYHSSKEEKIAQLKQLHIALYDVVESCVITNSSDATIQQVSPIFLTTILKNTNIFKIYLNGQTAYRLFLKFFPQFKNYCQLLPSTSSANAQYSLSKLIEAWSVIQFDLSKQNELPLKQQFSI